MNVISSYCAGIGGAWATVQSSAGHVFASCRSTRRVLRHFPGKCLVKVFQASRGIEMRSQGQYIFEYYNFSQYPVMVIATGLVRYLV